LVHTTRDHGPWTQVPKMTPVFTDRGHGPWTRVPKYDTRVHGPWWIYW